MVEGGGMGRSPDLRSVLINVVRLMQGIFLVIVKDQYSPLVYPSICLEITCQSVGLQLFNDVARPCVIH